VDTSFNLLIRKQQKQNVLFFAGLWLLEKNDDFHSPIMAHLI